MEMQFSVLFFIVSGLIEYFYMEIESVELHVHNLFLPYFLLFYSWSLIPLLAKILGVSHLAHAYLSICLCTQ